MTALDMFPETKSHPEEELDERYTLRQTMDLVRRVLGITHFDLDIAACEESHWADRYYTKADDALVRPFFPDGVKNVWCNPPYSEIEPWVLRTWDQMRNLEKECLLAMLLPSNRTDQPFWQKHVEPFRDERWRVMGSRLEDWRFSSLAPRLTTIFLPSRIQFGFPGNPLGINVKNSPPFGCVLLVWRQP